MGRRARYDDFCGFFFYMVFLSFPCCAVVSNFPTLIKRITTTQIHTTKNILYGTVRY